LAKRYLRCASTCSAGETETPIKEKASNEWRQVR
jgi:hypothetical protein